MSDTFYLWCMALSLKYGCRLRASLSCKFDGTKVISSVLKGC